MNKKCIVTGGAGFIASHLVDRLLEQGYEVTIIDNLSNGRKENINPKANFYQIDINDAKVSEVFEKVKPDIVFHYAAQIDVRKSVDDPIESAKTNILGSLNILENCRKFGVKKIVFASSGGAIYGEAETIPTSENYPPEPVNPYGIEKLIIEHYLDFYQKQYGLPYLILRFANVYGPRQNSKGEGGVVAVFCDKMASGQDVTINGDGTQTRDFVFVQDIIGANMVGVLEDKNGIFNIATGIETDINDLFAKLKTCFDLEVKGVHLPAIVGEQKRSCLDVAKAKKELGWEPEYDLQKGLTETGQWFKQHG